MSRSGSGASNQATRRSSRARPTEHRAVAVVDGLRVDDQLEVRKCRADKCHRRHVGRGITGYVHLRGRVAGCADLSRPARAVLSGRARTAGMRRPRSRRGRRPAVDTAAGPRGVRPGPSMRSRVPAHGTLRDAVETRGDASSAIADGSSGSRPIRAGATGAEPPAEPGRTRRTCPTRRLPARPSRCRR